MDETVGMKRISSRMTFFQKRIFPTIWFGVLGLMGLVLARDVITGRAPAVMLLPLLLPIAFGYVIMRNLIWDLVDAVYDCGDHLLVRNADREERVDLSNVIDVSYTTFTNPERVTLKLREPIGQRQKIVFNPPSRLFRIGCSPVVEALIQRIGAAKSV
jgi:hypothetical protein